MNAGDRIRELAKAHPTWGVSDIAEHLGCTKPNITHIAQRYGINLPRRRSQAIIARNDEIARLYEEGVPGGEIAARFGVSRSLVSVIASDAGLRRHAPQVEIPRWVPSALVDDFRAIARRDGEEVAASHVRRLKAEMARAGA